MSHETIGAFLDLHASAVSKYVHCYLDKGLSGLRTLAYGTNQSELEVYQSSILADFTQNPGQCQSSQRTHCYFNRYSKKS